MTRKKCEKRGHLWKCWEPGDWEAFCGRFGCKAKVATPHGAFFNALLDRMDGNGESRIGTEKYGK